MNKFSKAAATKTSTAKKPTSRWAKVKASEDRAPIIARGEYTALHKGARIKDEQGTWGSISFEVLTSTGEDATPVGDEGIMLQGMDDRFNIGLGKIKAYVMALIGCASDDEYDAFDPDGEFLDAVFGQFPEDEERAAELAAQVADMVTDREIHFKVRKGKDIVDKKTGEPTGDYYREFTWTTNEAAE
jgi:hypothetical protein